jgi:hypothetical protein
MFKKIKVSEGKLKLLYLCATQERQQMNSDLLCECGIARRNSAGALSLSNPVYLRIKYMA